MADVFDRATRSRIMSRIRGKDTGPEMAVRRGLHAQGLRFCLHARSLPGKPDLVFPRYRVAMLVNGCWWHQHDCGRFRPPKSNLDFWLPKLERNRRNDARVLDLLGRLGWRVIVVWECEINGMDWEALARQIRDGLPSPKIKGKRKYK